MVNQFSPQVPVFRQRMPIPNGRHYAVLEIVPEASMGRFLTDDDLDRADQWFTHLRPDAIPDCSGPEIVRWHVPDADDGMDKWQGELVAGPRVAMLSTAQVTEARAEGFQRAVGVSLPSLVDWWIGVALSLPELLPLLGCDRGTLWLALQTCPSGGPPVVDLTFGELLVPRKGAPARSVPPWQCGPMPIALHSPLMSVLTEAAVSLLGHFSYRHPDACIGALGLPLPERHP